MTPLFAAAAGPIHGPDRSHVQISGNGAKFTRPRERCGLSVAVVRVGLQGLIHGLAVQFAVVEAALRHSLSAGALVVMFLAAASLTLELRLCRESLARSLAWRRSDASGTASSQA